jgi:sigma-B regulation protein RsbU (phosphoserine phosphatase)
MARTSKVIQTLGLQAGSPIDTLGQTNDLMVRDSRSALLLTAVYAVLDSDSGRMVYSNAGHCRPLWLQAATGQVEELAARGIILGAVADTYPYLEEHELDVAPRDLLVFYSDGVTEAMNTDRELFGEDRLQAVLAANGQRSAQEVLEAIVDAVRAFGGDTPQSDDLTLYVVRRSPPASGNAAQDGSW